MPILDKFQEAKEIWTNKKVIIDDIPGGWTKNDVFFASYHAMNGPSSRCIFYKQVPDTDDYGNTAVFLKKQNQFYQNEATDRGLEITVWVNEELSGDLDGIVDGYQQKTREFVKKIESSKDKKVDLIKTIIIEHQIDEVINNTMNKENARTVYFSIGKTREFAANIPLLMNASGASMFQLLLNKWMSLADQIRKAKPEEPFPDERIKPLLADALKWKKYIIDFLNGTW